MGGTGVGMINDAEAASQHKVKRLGKESGKKNKETKDPIRGKKSRRAHVICKGLGITKSTGHAGQLRGSRPGVPVKELSG